MNDLMSLGIHRAWKRDFVAALHPAAGPHPAGPGGRHGRHHFRLARGRGRAGHPVRHQRRHARPGRDRAATRAQLGEVRFLVADAELLPLPDRSVDVVAIAFGLRNVTDKPAALREARRVLATGRAVRVPRVLPRASRGAGAGV